MPLPWERAPWAPALEAAILLEASIIAFLILLNGVLAGAEIAIVSLRKTRLRELVERGSRWAISTQALRDNPERFLATVQVGITVIGTTAGAFGGSTLAVHLIPLFQTVGWLRPYAEEVAVGLVVVFISYLSIVVGELVPKSLAMRTPEVYARLIASLLRGLSRLSSPAVHLLAASSNLVLKLFGDRTSFTEARLSVDEIRHMVEDAAKVGSLHPGASSIAGRAIEFGELRVLDVMVPRHLVVSLPLDSDLEAVAAQLQKTPFSRLPLYGASPDDVSGYLAAKDLVLRRDRPGQARDLLRPAILVPETAKAINLLQRLQRERQQIAFVVDEQGGFSGLVTMEDLLEELVGDIFSEFRDERIAPLAWGPEGVALVPGGAPLREINRALGLDLPEGPQWTTLGGLCLAEAGHVLSPGDRVALMSGVEAEIREAHGPRILIVSLRRVQDGN